MKGYRYHDSGSRPSKEATLQMERKKKNQKE